MEPLFQKKKTFLKHIYVFDTYSILMYASAHTNKHLKIRREVNFICIS